MSSLKSTMHIGSCVFLPMLHSFCSSKIIMHQHYTSSGSGVRCSLNEGMHMLTSIKSFSLMANRGHRQGQTNGLKELEGTSDIQWDQGHWGY